MDKVTRFVSDQNIARFVEALNHETDAKRQGALRGLLIEEENRFGSRVERLELVERHLRGGAMRIEQQKITIERLAAKGADLTEAERLLRNFVVIQEMFLSFRATLVEKLDQA